MKIRFDNNLMDEAERMYNRQRIVRRRPAGVLFLGGLLGIGMLIGGCRGGQSAGERTGILRVVATTNIVADLVTQIGGSHVAVSAIMGPGIDPHLYKASEGDVSRMAGADVIFYSGLHLEGKMTELFEQMDERGKATVAVTDGIPRERLIESATFGGNYDPHVWFDVTLWMDAARYVAVKLSELDPDHAPSYNAAVTTYLESMSETNDYIHGKALTLPEDLRVLITSHDAFGYFGRIYGFDVRGLQGISTATEAGAADVKALVEFVVKRHLPAIFVESSVSPRGIEAVREAVRSRGGEVRIGGKLFSDALGSPETPEGTYLGMVRYNANTIVDALATAPERSDG